MSQRTARPRATATGPAPQRNNAATLVPTEQPFAAAVTAGHR